MAKLTTHLKPNTIDATTYIVVLGKADLTLDGKEVEVHYRDRLLGNFYVHNITTVALMDVTDDHLKNLPREYLDKRVFWSRVERAYRSGLPGEYEVSFITLGNWPKKFGPTRKWKSVKARTEEDTQSRLSTLTLEEFFPEMKEAEPEPEPEGTEEE